MWCRGIRPQGSYNLALFICKCLFWVGDQVAGRSAAAAGGPRRGFLCSSRFMSTAATSLSLLVVGVLCCVRVLVTLSAVVVASVGCRFAEKRFAIY